MTNAEKVKFIRAEGWKAFGLGRGWHADPAKPRGHDTESAYRIASRRKAAREVRRLKAAGCRFGLSDWGFWMWMNGAGGSIGWTRAEALATLPQEGR